MINPKDESTNYTILTYVWVIAFSIATGLVAYLRKIQLNQPPKLNILEIITDLASSAISGLITYWLCKHAQLDAYITASLIGIAGHMGARTIILLEQLLSAALTRESP